MIDDTDTRPENEPSMLKIVRDIFLFAILLTIFTTSVILYLTSLN